MEERWRIGIASDGRANACKRLGSTLGWENQLQLHSWRWRTSANAFVFQGDIVLRVYVLEIILIVHGGAWVEQVGIRCSFLRQKKCCGEQGIGLHSFAQVMTRGKKREFYFHYSAEHVPYIAHAL